LSHGPEAESTIAAMPLFGRGGDEVEQAGGADPGAALTDALERYRAMPVPERAALVLATVAPAIAEHWDAARVDPRQLMEPTLVKPLSRRPTRHPRRGIQRVGACTPPRAL
jgi:hypothetical protein